MASPPGDPIPFAAEAQMYADLGDSDSDTSASSAFTASDLDQTRRICRWRTHQFNDRECSRYFDCPSHIVERSLSDDEDSLHEDAAHDADAAVDADPIVHDTNLDMPTTNFIVDPVQPDDDIHDVQQVPNLDERTIFNSTTDPTEPDVPVQNTSSMLDTDDLIHAQTPPEVEPAPADTINNDRVSSNTELSPTRDADDDMIRAAGIAMEGDHGLSGLPEPRRARTPVSRERMDAPLPSPRRVRTLSESAPSLPQPPLPQPPLPQLPLPQLPLPQLPLPQLPRGEVEASTPSEWSVPRWQPDAEVTYCPICRAQFSFFVRKHHCRKCGRVVCNSCSPHRIIIPYQYIVRPPGSEVTMPQSLLIDGLGTGYFDVNTMSGGERVRLCNPCVPDPNIAPPQSPNSPATLSPRPTHQRSRSSAAGSYLAPSNRHGAVFASGTGNEPYQYLSARTRSITMGNPMLHPAHGSSSRRARSGTHQTPIERLLSGGSSSSYPDRYTSLGEAGSSSRQRALPPTPQIAEEDECPICHCELPSRALPNFESLRESHITSCIQSHSAYGTPREGGGSPVPPRRTGMYTYPATEKDCIDDAECTICLEEFTVGVPMARLECLCRFHRSCISAWFVNHPGRCPVHQHDGFGY